MRDGGYRQIRSLVNGASRELYRTVMDLRRLRNFVRVAELGSLSKASDRLGLAQSALSRQMQLLEHEVGAALLVRHGRGVSLTEAGRALFDRAPVLLGQFDSMLDEVHGANGRVGGRVALGVIPSVSCVLAERLARRVALDLPHVSLRIVEGYAGHLLDWLHRGELDVALVYGAASAIHARTTPLLMDDLVVVAPAEAALARTAPLRLTDLAGRRLVLPSHPHGLRVLVEDAARRQGVDLIVRFEADSLRVLIGLVRSGLGWTVLPESAVAEDEAAGRVSIARLTRPTLTRRIDLAEPQDRATGRAAQATRALLLSEISAALQDGAWRAKLLFAPEGQGA